MAPRSRWMGYGPAPPRQPRYTADWPYPTDATELAQLAMAASVPELIRLACTATARGGPTAVRAVECVLDAAPEGARFFTRLPSRHQRCVVKWGASTEATTRLLLRLAAAPNCLTTWLLDSIPNTAALDLLWGLPAVRAQLVDFRVQRYHRGCLPLLWASRKRRQALLRSFLARLSPAELGDLQVNAWYLVDDRAHIPCPLMRMCRREALPTLPQAASVAALLAGAGLGPSSDRWACDFLDVCCRNPGAVPAHRAARVLEAILRCPEVAPLPPKSLLGMLERAQGLHETLRAPVRGLLEVALRAPSAGAGRQDQLEWLARGLRVLELEALLRLVPHWGNWGRRRAVMLPCELVRRGRATAAPGPLAFLATAPGRVFREAVLFV